MDGVEYVDGAGAARPGTTKQGGPSPIRETVALSHREVDDIRQLVGYVTDVRRGVEGVLYYTAKDYDEEIEGRSKAFEVAKALGMYGIRSYLERRGIIPDGIKAKEKRWGFEHAFHGKIRFYVKLGNIVHVFEEGGDGRGRYLGEFTVEELEESGI
jgi:hypothetical protein